MRKKEMLQPTSAKTHHQIISYALLFNLVGKLLYIYPSMECLELIRYFDLATDLPLHLEDENFKKGAKLLKQWSDNSKKISDKEAISELRVDATYLFVGLQSMVVPPWESFYFNKERMIFQEEEKEVREWYNKYGLRTRRRSNEPDDHIGFELEFLGFLLEQMSETEIIKRKNYLDDAIAFINTHPKTWIEKWSHGVCAYAQTDFYKGLALISVSTLYSCLEFLENI